MEDESGVARSHQSAETTQVGVGEMRRYLGVHRRKTLDQRGGHLGPVAAVRAADHDQPVGCDPHLPRRHRAQPAADVDHGDHPGLFGKKRERKTGETGAGTADQTEHPAGFEADGEGRDGAGRRDAEGVNEEEARSKGTPS